jgi:hypothetical protein
MKSSNLLTAIRQPLFLGFIGVVLGTGPALSADMPRDAQSQMRDVLVGTPRAHAPMQDQSRAGLDRIDPASNIEIQALVRRVILGTPGDEVTQQRAAALNATTDAPTAGSAPIEGRRFADAQHQVQRTLQGGAG